jgi:hypothetical protein
MTQQCPAVLLVVFNRPECAAQVLAEIRRARPARLFVAADGPRADRPADGQRCAAVRALIADGVDWECEVRTLYADQNMGCAHRVSSGITWFFEQVEEGIVLEDDCLPAPSFFPFCQELLARYRHDSRIGQICGTPRIANTVPRRTSYIFSRYGPIWGWASWRRAWQWYDLLLQNWPSAKEAHALDAIVISKQEKQKRMQVYEQLYQGNLYTWDYQWGYAKMTQSMLSIIPTVNLIENLGFGEAGTHTTGATGPGLTRGPVTWPLRHPEFVLLDYDFDLAFSREFAPTGFHHRITRFFRKWL